MLNIILFIILITLSFDLFLMGSVFTFIERKPKFKQYFQVITVPVLIVSVFFIGGYFLGEWAASFFKNQHIWYAATILFVMSIKMLYDGLRLNKIKKTINPLDRSGMILLSVFVGINAFFIGASFGFMKIELALMLRGILVFVFAILAGLFTGKRLNRLISFRFEILASLVYFLCAIIIVINL